MPSVKKKPLVWKSHTVSAFNRPQLRLLSREFSLAGPAPLALPSVSSAVSTCDLPDLTGFPTPRDKAVRLLQAAAAIEHALMMQYIYAGYGFSTPHRDILNIASEEMSHLMTVQNLLKLVGAEPDLGRQDFRGSGF